MDALVPGWIRPLEAELAFARRVVGRNVVSVRRGDKALRRIVRRGQIIAAPESRPLETPVSRHREQAVPIWATWGQSARHPADIAFHVCVDLVQRRGPPVDERS